MCQVTLIIVIHYVQMRVNILFLFKEKKKKVKPIISGYKVWLNMLQVKIYLKVRDHFLKGKIPK